MSLTQEIMNIPCRREDWEFRNAFERQTYKEGHRDARHAAVELVNECAPPAAVPEGALPPHSELIAAAEAVIARWDSPKWKDEAPTADYIARLRRAVAADRAQQGELVGYVRESSLARLGSTDSTATIWSKPHASDYVPVYRAATKAAAPADAPKDHEIREAINQLRDIAVQYHATQQLRSRIAEVVLTLCKSTPPKDQ